ncbi:hypothetical protein GGS23DRAFT_598549 [Durotheca rogersii]|uniref:uncharacterized protein n=1 Tax=Durotheca rogersii TaxID=419775 RepID=UPI00221EF9DC|nr:uncharacterized protein GGS23DRAFT_598549 [Durotheca rogersii]KAI5861395.1 hypothetical protein GGS23DRAFT_598549 [Durotheca rogersii]
MAMSRRTQPKPNRRKLRKGTHSCWECKRRKMKCIFNAVTDAACNGCLRRGSECVSQEFPEGTSLALNGTSKMRRRLAGVETRINNQLTPHADVYGADYPRRTPTPSDEDGGLVDDGVPAPTEASSGPPRRVTYSRSSNYRTSMHDTIPGDRRLFETQSTTDMTVSNGKCGKLSRLLYESLPSREDTHKICEAIRRPSVLIHETLTIPYTILGQTGLKTPESLLEFPGPDSHPILIARHMLRLAAFLLRLHPDIHEEIKGLSESPRDMMERLADLAINLVTTNDELLGSIESLECIMTESMYQINNGNLRRSWIAGRRAMSIAQLMGLNRSDNRAQYIVLDPQTKYDPQLMWFRIVFLDRNLCLMLGLPQGCLDRSMASEAMLANDTRIGRLERIHCVVASGILERNNESDPGSDGLALTKTLDLELQRAARRLPSKWWLTPTLDTASTNSQTLFWDTRRLFTQVLHFNLLNQLHLPYMLRSSSAERKYDYSRITCVNASREILSRFIALRSFNRIAYSCRTIDFYAIMAGITLLLAHLDSHRSGPENLLAHQYLGDRAMVERVQENMAEVNRISSDALSAQSADLLGRLLAIQFETTDGYSSGARKVSVEEAGSKMVVPGQDDNTTVSVHIPYFGIIKIAREGMSKEIPKLRTTPTATRPAQSQAEGRSCAVSLETPEVECRTSTPRNDWSSKDTDAGVTIPLGATNGRVETPSMMALEVPDTSTKTQTRPAAISGSVIVTDNIATDFPSLLQDSRSNTLLPYCDYPGLAAGGEDWAFQGVDMAFFESLMRSVDNEGNEDAERTTCPGWA